MTGWGIINVSMGLRDINLISKGSLKKSVGHIQSSYVPFAPSCKFKNKANRRGIDNGTERL